jgi:hypothetical protein
MKMGTVMYEENKSLVRDLRDIAKRVRAASYSTDAARINLLADCIEEVFVKDRCPCCGRRDT